jgi:hypothetical protein
MTAGPETFAGLLERVRAFARIATPIGRATERLGELGFIQRVGSGKTALSAGAIRSARHARMAMLGCYGSEPRPRRAPARLHVCADGLAQERRFSARLGHGVKSRAESSSRSSST